MPWRKPATSVSNLLPYWRLQRATFANLSLSVFYTAVSQQPTSLGARDSRRAVPGLAMSPSLSLLLSSFLSLYLFMFTH